MHKRLLALLVLVGLAVLVITAPRKSDGGVRVQAGGEPTTALVTSTTQTPTTSTSVVPTTAPTTTIPTTAAPTTVAVTEPSTEPPTDPPTTQAAPRAPPVATTAPALQAEEVVPEEISTEPPTPAVRTQTGVCMTDEATCHPPDRVPWRYCEEWHDLAAQVGWPESQGPTISYVMHRESSCNPSAYNPTPCGGGNHATGLMQLCGWACPPGGCRDAGSNLAKALDLWQSSGWCPWVLRGDPVTGHACG